MLVLIFVLLFCSTSDIATCRARKSFPPSAAC
jgi:hypothetical protein